MFVVAKEGGQRTMADDDAAEFTNCVQTETRDVNVRNMAGEEVIGGRAGWRT